LVSLYKKAGENLAGDYWQKRINTEKDRMLKTDVQTLSLTPYLWMGSDGSGKESGDM
jgi:hypothetical protein